MIVRLLELQWRNVTDGLEQASIVEPVDPFQSCELDILCVSPGAAAMNDLGLVQPVDRFRECVVVGVASAADRRLDTALGESFSVANRQILLRFKASSQHCLCEPRI